MRFLSVCYGLYVSAESAHEFADDESTYSIPDVAAVKPPKDFHYAVDHFVNGKWQRRGDMLVRYALEQYSVRLTDDASFAPSELVAGELAEAAKADAFYKMRLRPGDESFSLYASVPARLLTVVEDKHDTLELTLSPLGIPIGFNYRVRDTLGLHLFEHTVVHISEPHYALIPQVTPKKEEEKSTREQQGAGSLLSRYWWVILIVVVLMAAGVGGEEKK
eukprot:GEMP01032818.1.p1 GENE.GEMP01032818.1~~GEMP01032818.1.p1  ORF type:complete len:219 (+),score=52.22 GEMP01032818.1:74-730(+)